MTVIMEVGTACARGDQKALENIAYQIDYNKPTDGEVTVNGLLFHSYSGYWLTKNDGQNSVRGDMAVQKNVDYSDNVPEKAFIYDLNAKGKAVLIDCSFDFNTSGKAFAYGVNAKSKTVLTEYTLLKTEFASKLESKKAGDVFKEIQKAESRFKGVLITPDQVSRTKRAKAKEPEKNQNIFMAAMRNIFDIFKPNERPVAFIKFDNVNNQIWSYSPRPFLLFPGK
jgi:hypothetical protein